jgi:hypothetical protein
MKGGNEELPSYNTKGKITGNIGPGYARITSVVFELITCESSPISHSKFVFLCSFVIF